MEVKYETEKKEMRIAMLEKENILRMWITVTGIIVVLLAFGILFFRHKLNIQKRKQAEQQIKQLEQEKQLVATQAVIDGETAERSRLARDLHDGLGGMLSVVKLNLKDMKGYTVLDNLDVDHFHKAMDMLDKSITELRRVAHHIMPESLMRYGLKTSLDDFCRAIPGADFRFFGNDADLDNRLKTLIYRCTYELVNNAVKHANATSVNVQLMIENGLISLSVHDNGAGFDPEKITAGAGLENVRVRVASYNGKMTIYSLPGKGTEVTIEIEPA
jgi:signal transduction histidine kinase